MKKYLGVALGLLFSFNVFASSNMVKEVPQNPNLLSQCNTEQCRSYFNKFSVAVKRGHFEGLSTLGQLYYNGYGTERNVEKALFYLKKAAKNKKNAAAQYKVGLIHLVDEEHFDIDQAINYLYKAASRNYKDANFLLGVLSYNEQYFPANLTLADNYLSKALRQRHPQIQQIVDDLVKHESFTSERFPKMWQEIQRYDVKVLPDGRLIWPEDETEVITVMSPPIEELLASELSDYRSPRSANAVSRIPTLRCANIIGCYSFNSMAGLDGLPGSFASVVGSGGNRISSY